VSVVISVIESAPVPPLIDSALETVAEFAPLARLRHHCRAQIDNAGGDCHSERYIISHSAAIDSFNVRDLAGVDYIRKRQAVRSA
jgi:hypothetical protein